MHATGEEREFVYRKVIMRQKRLFGIRRGVRCDFVSFEREIGPYLGFNARSVWISVTKCQEHCKLQKAALLLG